LKTKTKGYKQVSPPNCEEELALLKSKGYYNLLLSKGVWKGSKSIILSD